LLAELIRLEQALDAEVLKYGALNGDAAESPQEKLMLV
jgi:hypothetical protein